MPKGSDESWARKLFKEHIPKSKHFVKPRMSEKAFIVRHYADDVIYDCNGFVEKNRDLINNEHLLLLKASEVRTRIFLSRFVVWYLFILFIYCLFVCLCIYLFIYLFIKSHIYLVDSFIEVMNRQAVI